jgi:tRNA (cytidine/uridine-2'-O-)-methyltransferase
MGLLCDPVTQVCPDADKSGPVLSSNSQKERRQPLPVGQMRLTLFQPDIPQNAGAILRLGACLGVAVDVIEPAGFALGDRNLRRAGLDYLEAAALVRHASWQAWRESLGDNARIILLTTKAETAYTDFRFTPDDALLFGRESSGAPEEIHAEADARLLIPLRPGRRSLNVAQAAAMALGEALRQTNGFEGGSGMETTNNVSAGLQ